MTAAAVVLPVALAGVLTIPLSAKLSYQNARNDFLEDAISVLNKKIEEVKKTFRSHGRPTSPRSRFSTSSSHPTVTRACKC